MTFRAKSPPQQGRRSWRDVLSIHPAANRIPEPTDQEKRRLADDLRGQPQRIPVVLVRVAGNSDLQLLDGRTRLDLQEAAGIQVIDADGQLLVPYTIEEVPNDAEAEDLSESLNLHRRHLSGEARRKLIAAKIKRDPSRSDRQIAKMTKASPSTVGTVRAKMEARGEVSKLDTRTDAKGVKQPARKATKDRERPAKGRRGSADPFRIPGCAEFARREKLGPTIVNKLRGTSLGRAAEMDELIELDRAGQTEVVKALIAAAIAGEQVSALRVKSPTDLEDRNRQLECEIKDLKTNLAVAQAYPGGEPFIRASTAEQLDISATDTSEVGRQAAHIQKLENELAESKAEIAGLKREVEELRQARDKRIEQLIVERRKYADAPLPPLNLARLPLGDQLIILIGLLENGLAPVRNLVAALELPANASVKRRAQLDNIDGMVGAVFNWMSTTRDYVAEIKQALDDYAAATAPPDTPPPPPPADDGLDIPEYLRRDKKEATT